MLTQDILQALQTEDPIEQKEYHRETVEEISLAGICFTGCDFPAAGLLDAIFKTAFFHNVCWRIACSPVAYFPMPVLKAAKLKIARATPVIFTWRPFINCRYRAVRFTMPISGIRFGTDVQSRTAG